MREVNIEKFIFKKGINAAFYNNNDDFIEYTKIIILTDFKKNMENQYEKFGLSSKNNVKGYSLKVEADIKRGCYFKIFDNKYYINTHKDIFLNNKIICVEYNLSMGE